MHSKTTLKYLSACYTRYLRHCDIYKVSALSFVDWLVTA